MKYRPLVLTVLDGWGCRDVTHGNAIAAARLPHWRALLQHYPHTTLEASGLAVGLPEGVMGNSEVGHMNLGSGRVVNQGVTIIDAAIADGDFAKNETLHRAFLHVQRSGGRLHLMGLLSDGCVHSSIVHCFALIDAAVAGEHSVRRPLLSGRTRHAAALGTALRRAARIKTRRSGARRSDRERYRPLLCDGPRPPLGSYVPAYDLLANGHAEHRAGEAQTAVREAYARGEDDEFVLPTIIAESRPIEDGDAFVFFNFRPDRARQLTTAFNAGTTIYFDDGFGAFKSKRYRNPLFATMTKYEEMYTNPVLFGPRPQYDTFGEVLAKEGLRQLRLAETEKYAHVTYFLNGGREDQFEGEERILIPSDRSVPTYDLAPAMRAREITDAAVNALASANTTRLS